MGEQAEIPLKIKRVLPILLGALVFALLGTGMLWVALQIKAGLFAKVAIFSIGLASLLFFGTAFLLMLAKLLSKKPGMVLNDEGFIDNASGLPAGFIAWKEVRKINYRLTGSYTYLVIMLKNPDKYINSQTNFLKRAAMRMNTKISGSPVHIPVNFLDTNLNTLNILIAERRFRKKTGEVPE